MASVEVESAATNTFPQKVENTLEATPQETKPVAAAPEPMAEETTVDVPPPVEEPPTTKDVVETKIKVVEDPKSNVEEPKEETTQEEVGEAEEVTLATAEAVPEETPAVTAVPEEAPAVTADRPATEEAKEYVEEGEKPAEVVTTEVATEK